MDICGALIRPADSFTLMLTAGDNNDVSFSSIISSVLVTSNASGSTITGLIGSAGNANGVTVQLTNDNTGQLTIAHDNAASAASNRIYCPGNINLVVMPRETIELFYLLREARWFVKSAIAGGSGSAAAGSDTEVQYNASGAFGADPDFTWDASSNRLNVSSGATSGSIRTADNLSGASGSIQIRPGVSTGANGSTLAVGAGHGGVTNNGGTLFLSGGNGGDTSGHGGSTVLSGGNSNDGNGGSVTVQGMNALGTNRNGGNVLIQAGTPTGTGTRGVLTLNAPITLGALAGATTGAQTATFAATNKPGVAAGAPAIWIPIVISGTTYWIPAFAN